MEETKLEMTAINALKAIKSICKRFDKENCDGCPFEQGNDCPFEDNYNPETVIEIIKQYNREQVERVNDQEAIKDIEFIRDAYKHLSENGADRYRAVGKRMDCSVEVETNVDLYKHYAKSLTIAIVAMKEIQQYHEIGTIEEYREAREKQIPKKPITYENTNRADCPICGNTVRGINKPFGDWCSKCGQALDWKDKNKLWF